MVAADLVRAALACVLTVWHNDPIVVYAVAFGLSAGTAFFNPASNSVLPSVVGDREIVAANSATWTSAVLSQVVLAPLAGGLVALVGPGWAFGLNAASFVVSVLALRGLRLVEPPGRSAAAGCSPRPATA